MIVPSNRLMFWFAVVVLPFSILGALSAAAVPVSVALVGGFVLMAVIDAGMARRSLEGIGIEMPPVARMSMDREASLELRICNSKQRARALRIALPLPREIESPHEDRTVALPAESEWSRLHWPCRGLRRGRYHIDAVHAEAGSPLGFWGARTRLPVSVEVRVYPNLLTERRNLAALFLNRGALGLHAQRQVGKGREFEKLREYVSSDSFDDIHWKATVRRGHPVTKVFQIERTQEVYVIIDASRLSARRAAEPVSGISTLRDEERRSASAVRDPGVESSTLERFITAALVLGLAAEQQGDLFGLLTFGDRVETFLRARNGKAHYSACRDTVYTLQPRQVNPDFDEVCSFIRLRLRRRALLVFLTSLDDPVLAENFVRNIDLISRQHLVLVNMIQPPGARPLFSQADVSTVDDVYERLGGHLRWHGLQELGKVLQRRGVGFNVMEQERLGLELVSRYLNVKRRQLL